MPTIKVLSQDIVSKIAAGEVIEKPVYAVKELIDNSIDAKSTQIKITLQDAGLKRIVCRDNGIGMDKDDLRQSFMPHTTSKIESAEDLYNIQTLGFRGEALSSIASVSLMTIRSRQKDSDHGYQIEIKNGQIENFQPASMAEGTEITIQNLFYNTPARIKFLKSEQTELRLITELIISYSFAYPEISFSLIHNDRTIVDMPLGQTLETRIKKLHGEGHFNYLLKIKNNFEYLEITGYVGKPQSAATNSRKQFIYVNNRRVYDKNISYLVKETFGSLLEPKLYPSFYLFISLPPERVDINVHPRKEQVAFSEDQMIGSAIQNTIADAIKSNDIKYYDLRWNKNQQEQNQKFVLHDGGTATYTGKLLKETTNTWSLKNDINETSKVAQFHNLYIISQTKKGILLIDQHAAHERILYEQFLDEYQKLQDKKEIQVLSKPLLLEFSPDENVALEEHIISLENIGFKFQKVKNELYLITIPEVFRDRDLQSILTETLDDLTQSNIFKKVDLKTDKMLSYLACRSAIKAGEKLNTSEMENLIKKLSETRTQYTCPHGRPVQVELSLDELHRLFHRK
jgi:DNA mismatch repair protein MutL